MSAPGPAIGELVIPSRYNGPPASGNGGYSCGLLAAFIDGPARVRLHAPPPLDKPLRVQRDAGGAVAMYDGDTLVGSATATSLALEVPPAPPVDIAAAAMPGFPCYDDHPYATCFVCGPQRPLADGLEIFAGPVPGRDGLVACAWQPAADLVDARGDVLPAVLWAALDCPGYFAAMGDDLRPALLGQLEAALRRPVGGDQPLVVYAWPLGIDGRKRFAGSAVATAAGEVVACARSLWIEVRT